MSKSAKDAVKEEVKLELTPMIDVTFLILIFFMCTLKFKTLEGKLISYLPTDKGLSNAQEQVPKEDAEIILKVPKSEYGKGALERKIIFLRAGSNTPFGESLGVTIGPDKRVSGLKLSPPDTFEKIRDYLERIREADPASKAKINAYARTPHVYVVQTLNLMMEAGFTDISYSGIPKTLIRDLTTGVIRAGAGGE